MNSCQPTHKRDSGSTSECEYLCVYLSGEGGLWGKIEGTTYIKMLLSLSLTEFSGLAITVSLGVIPVVPCGGSVGGRGEQGAGF